MTGRLRTRRPTFRRTVNDVVGHGGPQPQRPQRRDQALAARHVFVLGVFVVTMTGLIVACNESARYRVLSFIFDGVPKPGESDADSKETEKPKDVVAEETKPEPNLPDPAHPVVVADVFVSHPPYRDFQCRRCHEPAGVGLILTPQEGLCARCHGGIPGDAPFVHAPVAVRDCLFCHHFHESKIPGLLLRPPNETCMQCHDRADLTTGLHHPDDDERRCIQCHNPHAGTVRYFLKRTDP
jgi:predicted CXXCH cytochrome family protein